METLLRAKIKSALETLDIEPVSFVVDYPTDKTAGADYFSNVALVLAKQLGETPRDIAAKLQTALTGQIELVETIEVAGPGFLNFTLARDYFSQQIAAARAAGADWGSNDDLQAETVIVEYTSPNLFKPLHVGNLVGNITGECLVRLFAKNGARVVRANYPSDIGLPVAKAVWGLKQTGNDPTDIEQLGAAYRVGNEAYEKDGTEKEEIIAVNQTLYAGTDEALVALRAAGIKTSNEQIKLICTKLGTAFDLEIFESEAAPVGAQLVEEHRGDIFTESDGAVVYDESRSHLHTRVFLNSKGLPTYEAKDLGHFKLKHDQYPDWTHSVIVTGSEQREYFKVVYAAIREVFTVPEDKKLEHIPTGFLSLTTGKMSSRSGNVLTGEAIIAEMEAAAHDKIREENDVLATEVAVAALKYEILRHGAGSDIVFDKEQALSFEGASGPYLQYTHARIVSVVEKAYTLGIMDDTKSAPEQAYEVEKLVEQFPTVIKAALTERAPQQVITYLTELASAFNSFYAAEPIADPSDVHAPYKVAVAKAVQTTLQNGLHVLGIKAPEKM